MVTLEASRTGRNDAAKERGQLALVADESEVEDLVSVLLVSAGFAGVVAGVSEDDELSELGEDDDEGVFDAPRLSVL